MSKVLLIAPWLPWPPHDGARIRILETLKYLSPNHDVTLLANVQSRDERESIEAASGLCSRVITEYLPQGRLHQFSRMLGGVGRRSSLIQSFHFSRQLARRIRELTSKERFDIVQIELSFLSHYASAIDPACGARTVLATHNIETQRFERELKLGGRDARHLVLQLDAWLNPRWESKALQQFDGALAVSESDRAWIQRQAPKCQVRLAPNGVDVDYFAPQRSTSAAAPSIAFTGLMDYPPNVDAVCWFVESIFPTIREAYPNLVFKIVGARPSQKVLALASQPQVEVTGEVPDVRPYINEAMAFVVPLRSGGGTRLKILQAMAMAAPVISTRVGAEGLDVEHDRNILFAEDAREFVDRIGQLIENPGLATAIGESGLALVHGEYAWSRCLRELDTLYAQLLDGNAS